LRSSPHGRMRSLLVGGKMVKTFQVSSPAAPPRKLMLIASKTSKDKSGEPWATIDLEFQDGGLVRWEAGIGHW